MFQSVSPEIQSQFGIIDYIIFGLLLGLSSAIGIYYGFISKQKQNTTSEYLLGSKNMGLFPISISLIVSHISGMTLLGYPVEVYAYGTQIFMSTTSLVLVGLAVNYIYLPVFYDLQMPSCYTYFEKRFNKNVKYLGSAIFLIAVLSFLPVVIYTPSLALSQVTGINIFVIAAVGCAVCIFYTTIGGLRTVVWTDILQFILMVGTCLSIIYVGNESIGGFENMWNAADRGNRIIFFDLDPSPFSRMPFWSVTFGSTMQLVSNIGVSAVCIQRCLSLPTIEKAKKAVWIYMIGMASFFTYALIVGLQMYAKYETCDPSSNGLATKLDQVMPLYVMDVCRNIPGIPGLFVAGIFAAALSTLSSILNTLSCTIFEDFLRAKFFPNISEKSASNIMKLIVLVLGIVVSCLVLVVDKLGSIFQMIVTLSGVTSGALFGMFTIGMFCRRANASGVISGALSSFIIVSTMMVGTKLFGSGYNTLPMRTDGCQTKGHLINSTHIAFNSLGTNASTNDADDTLFWMFRISFMWYTAIRFFLVFIVGYPISLLTQNKESELTDEALLTPIMRSKEYKSKMAAEEKTSNIEITKF